MVANSETVSNAKCTKYLSTGDNPHALHSVTHKHTVLT